MKIQTHLEQLIDVPAENFVRIPTNVEALDEFLGGGFVQGQVLLIAGVPGAGKSTILTQLCARLLDLNEKVLYVAGEETLGQIKTRAERMGALRPDFWITDETNLQEMYKAIEKVNPKFVIIDSLQTIHGEEVVGGKAKKMKIDGIADDIVRYCKMSNDKTFLVVGHSTKAGTIRGALTIQHAVDTTLFMRNTNGLRHLITLKNRFGPDALDLPLTMSEVGFKELELKDEEPEVKQGFWSRLLFGERR